MPSDIRSFFGGGPKPSPAAPKKDESAPKKPAPKKSARASRVIDDSDDDEESDVKYDHLPQLRPFVTSKLMITDLRRRPLKSRHQRR